MARCAFFSVCLILAWPFALCDPVISLWASSVLRFSSQWSNSNRAAVQILGIANVYPSYGTSPQAWSVSRKSSDFIDLQFSSSLFVSDIFIYETFNAGSVIKVSGWNIIDQRWEDMWTGQATRLEHSRVFSPPLSKRAMVSTIRLDLNCSLSDSCQIDAVQIRGSPASPVVSKPIPSASLESQWAKRVIAVSSEDASSSKEILGPPEVYPSYGHSDRAWRGAAAGSSGDSIEVEFEKAVHVVGVFVYESLNGGAVVEIAASNADKRRDPVVLWSGVAQRIVTPRIFAPLLSKVGMLVDRIHLKLDHSASSDLSELDAVQMIGYLSGGVARTRSGNLDALTERTCLDGLFRGDSLRLESALCSSQHRYRAFLEKGPPGVLSVKLVSANHNVIQEIWRSDDYMHDEVNVLVHQDDGNLVVGFGEQSGDDVHDAPVREVWSANTAGMDTSVLRMDDDGVLRIYDMFGQILWNSTRKYPPNYAGCYTDLMEDRDMVLKKDMLANATVSQCISLCKLDQMHFAAVQDGHLCFCGDEFGRYDDRRPAWHPECWMGCSAREEDICGAPLRNSVYETGLPPPPAPTPRCGGHWMPQAAVCAVSTEATSWPSCAKLCEDKGSAFLPLSSNWLLADLTAWMEKDMAGSRGVWVNAYCRESRWQTKNASDYQDVVMAVWSADAIRQGFASSCDNDKMCLSLDLTGGSFQPVAVDCSTNDRLCLCEAKASTSRVNPGTKPSSGSVVCPRGWQKLDTHCYRQSEANDLFSQGVSYCKRKGASVVKIESADENNRVRKQYMQKPVPFWIGLQREDGVYHWVSDGSVLMTTSDFPKWGPEGSEHDNCVSMGTDGTWMKVTCDYVHIKTVCEKEAENH